MFFTRLLPTCLCYKYGISLLFPYCQSYQDRMDRVPSPLAPHRVMLASYQRNESHTETAHDLFLHLQENACCLRQAIFLYRRDAQFSRFSSTLPSLILHQSAFCSSTRVHTVTYSSPSISVSQTGFRRTLGFHRTPIEIVEKNT